MFRHRPEARGLDILRAFFRLSIPQMVAVAISVAIILIGIPLFPTAAQVTDADNVSSNTFATKQDWLAPTTSSAKLLNSLGYIDVLRQGDTYQVCASVTDDGNPPSEVTSVKTNMAIAGNVITTGQTQVPLSSGTFTCGGLTFNFQSGGLTADASIPEGARTFQMTAADGATNSATTSWAATIDNTAPTTSSFSTQNVGGGTVGLIENGDSFRVVVSETTIDLNRILSGWSGSSTAVFTKLLNNGFGANKDGLWICQANTTNCAGGTNADNILGDVNLNNKDYVNSTVVFNATITWDSSTRTFTITIGTCTSGCTSVGTGGNSTATFTPIAGSTQGGIRDQAGNNMSASSTATENSTHF